MKALVKSFAIFNVLLSSVALAHEAIEIKSSTPIKNAMLMEAPMELSVSFTKGVRLIKVVLKDSEGAKVENILSAFRSHGTFEAKRNQGVQEKRN